jgi:hypothetical protein
VALFLARAGWIAPPLILVGAEVAEWPGSFRRVLESNINTMAEELTTAADPSRCASDLWWSRRRLRYNVALIVAGLVGFCSYAAAVDRCILLHVPGEWEITIFTTVFQGFAYLVMIGVANICYFLGPWSERVFQPRNVATYRKTAFRLGFWFSILLAFTPSVVLFVSCSLHRGEGKGIILELIRTAIFDQLS